MTYRGFHIMQWAENRYSVYGRDMYAQWDGFKSIEAAQKFINDRLA